MKKNFIIVLLGIGLIIYASTIIASRNTIYYYTTSETENIEITTNERIKLGGFLPERSTFAKPIKAPSKDILIL